MSQLFPFDQLGIGNILWILSLKTNFCHKTLIKGIASIWKAKFVKHCWKCFTNFVHFLIRFPTKGKKGINAKAFLRFNCCWSNAWRTYSFSWCSKSISSCSSSNSSLRRTLPSCRRFRIMLSRVPFLVVAKLERICSRWHGHSKSFLL